MQPDLTQAYETVPEAAVPERGPEPRKLVESVPGYEILEELGRGGMGVVYRARQTSLNRIVALKMILAKGKASGVELDRFQAEAEVIGRLQHIHIVQVYEVGEHEGLPYFTLEYCPQGNLAKRIDGRPLPAIEAATVIERVARAMQAVHEKGVVHRDLKPANVLIAADGTPKVTDFGIAKSDHDGSQTGTGAILGTPSYMAPEQAQGNTKSVGPEADVYALGAMLYECVTGLAPFSGENAVEIIRKVLEEEPLAPRTIVSELDGDLEKIILKCLEKDPEKRYRSAAELADDLQRFVNGEPILARSVNLLERLQREIVRSRHDEKMYPWAGPLVTLGVIIALAHAATSLMLGMGLSTTPAYWIPRVIVLTAVVAWLTRTRSESTLLPTNPLERSLWAIWGGYLLAYISMFWVVDAFGLDPLHIYGPAMALSGLAWFASGGLMWGGSYVIGFLYMAAAPAVAKLASHPRAAVYGPLVFGSVWGVTLIALGLRYRRQMLRKQVVESAPRPPD